MPFPTCLRPKRRAVVDLGPEPDNRQSAIGTADASTQTAIGLVAGPKLFIHDIRDAPLYITRREKRMIRFGSRPSSIDKDARLRPAVMMQCLGSRKNSTCAREDRRRAAARTWNASARGTHPPCKGRPATKTKQTRNAEPVTCFAFCSSRVTQRHRHWVLTCGRATG